MEEVVELARVERSPPTAGWRSSPSHRPRPVNRSSQDDWVPYTKVRFEKYFVRKMRRAESEPFYERFLLERLNLRKIKEAV
jgi:sulfide:quinone oxidoreductase